MRKLTDKLAIALFRRGESETVEFKKGFDRETIETLSAFANTHGGRVFVGVSDTGQVSGVEVGKETLQNWVNQAKLSTANSLIPDADVLTIKAKTIVLLSISEYPIKPVACRGKYFKRINNANHQMTISEVVNEHLKSINTSWDCTIDELHSEADLSLDKVQAFVARISRAQKSEIHEDPLTMLRKLELLRDGRITRAAFLLFAAGETSLSTIELGRFQTPILIKDGARLQTDLISEVEGVMAFIKKHISKAYIITGEPQREERWEYPLEALREIVINAIVHRDYASTSDSIVKIFDDRIEIFNPGALPTGITVEKLLTGDYVSSVRNRKIADMFKEIGLVEKYGTGIQRMLREFETYGLPMPKFEEIGPGFRVTAYNKPALEQTTTQVATQVTTQVTTQVESSIVLLLKACKEPSTLSDLMHRMNLKSRKHFRSAILGPAIHDGLIEPTIPDKPKSRFQKYKLTEKGKKYIEVE
ncbi:MAG: ATP-binding protein [Desulfobacterales bacterium]|jgi:ATP-dependent DNA helicase RecG|nr:ATP-binding protein [Desulfobacterales bacterium]